MLPSLYYFYLSFSLAFGISSAQDINSSTCGPESICQSLVVNSSAWEASQHATSDFVFYNVPSNFSEHLPAGSLIHVEDATNLSVYSVPSSLSMSRIIYATTNFNGTIIPASAYVLWPYAPFASPQLKDDQLPFVAWAHGTSGFVKACAPSSYRNLQYHFMVPFRLALEGIAVIAPDYAGLGVSSLPSGEHIGHTWLYGPTQAADLANAIIAARAAFPAQLPPEGPFVAMGHSQGGLTAWAFAEQLVDKPLAGYKGTVALAPAVGYFHLLRQQLANLSELIYPTVLQLQVAVISSITAAFPSYNYSGLTPLPYDRLVNVMQPLQGCLPTFTLALADVPLTNITKPGWLSDPRVEAFSNSSDSGRKRFKGPLLVLAGGIDSVIDLPNLQTTVNDTCNIQLQQKWNESFEMVTYTAMNHFPLIQASSTKWLPWIKDRLTGKPSPRSGCVKDVVKGYRTEFTPQSIGPNFLETWAGPEEGWKLSF